MTLSTHHVFQLPAIFLLVCLASCASAPPLTEAGARVRVITAEQAKSCKFVQTVQYNDRIDSMGKTPSLMDAIGENNLRNEVGAVGANAYVSTKAERETFLGTVDYEGDAYICP